MARNDRFRESGISAPRMGIQRSLAAPGVAPSLPQAPKPPSEGFATALQNFLGAAAGTASAAAQFTAVHEELQQMKDSEDVIKSLAAGTGIPQQLRTVGVHNAVWQNEANKALDTLDPSTLPRRADEDDVSVLHRWLGTHTPPGAPDIYMATLREGGRQKFATFRINETRAAQAKVTNDLASNVRREAYSGDLDKTREAFAAYESVADALHLSEDQKIAALRDGIILAANEGRVEDVKRMVTLLPPEQASRLVDKAIEVFQAKAAEQAALRYEDEIMNSMAPDNALFFVIQDVQRRVDFADEKRDFSQAQAEGLINFATGLARKRFDDEFWTDYWAGKGTDETRRASIFKAKEHGILNTAETNQRLGWIKEADSFDGMKSVLIEALNAGKPTALGDEFKQPLIALAVDLGHIQAVPNKTKTHWTFMGVTPGHERQWAQLQETFALVPGAEQIIRNAESNLPSKETDIGRAIADYLILSPDLREKVAQGTGTLGLMRLRAAEDMALSGVDPRTRLSELASYEVIDMPREQAIAGVFGKDPTKPVQGVVKLTFTHIQAAVPRVLRSAGTHLLGDKIDEPPMEMANVYVDAAAREYLAQLPLVGHAVAQPRGHLAGLRASFLVAQPVLVGMKLERLRWIRGAPATTTIVAGEPELSVNVGEAILKDLKKTGLSDKYIKSVVMEGYNLVFDGKENRFKFVRTTPPFTEFTYTRQDGGTERFRSRGGFEDPKGLSTRPPALMFTTPDAPSGETESVDAFYNELDRQ